MLNPEPSPPPPPRLMNPVATPPNRETTSLRKDGRRVPLPPLAEIVDVGSSSFLTPISVGGTTKSNAISVEQYDTVSNPAHVVNLSDTEDDDDVRILNFAPQNTAFGKRKKVREESSNSIPFVCEICTDTKPASDSFAINGCCHVYCKECVATYVESRLEENVINIGCPVPGCRGLLEAEYCHSILAPRVFDLWGKALCEALIAPEEKFYCPFAECSALLIREGNDDIRESECPNCRRLFCALCRVPWHAEISCEEFQKLNADERQSEDVMLMNLAVQMKWKRCPRCRFYVAKTAGCMYMNCRCGSAFCYNCGTPNLTSSHTCPRCGH